ncbi:MAG TPA: TetR/AcrR family transcriptional regulator [Ferrovibrio sp.]|jgi:AcrR family transcriptional regulator|uniref:TetR/AcrR family transcriptional regulator n=1 Tax=Ferrovibrio sp. TaxID=1917215 RepID=UPI002ED15480
MPRVLSQAEIEAFRTRLCAAAEKRMARHGAEGLSMRQLAEDLGCSAMTPYRYFRDKNEIVAAVRTAALLDFAAALEAAARSNGNARKRGRAVGKAYIRFALENPDRYRLLHEALQCDPADFPDLARAQARSRRTVSAYIEDLVAEGELEGDPEVLGHIFWATTHGLLTLHLAGRLGGRLSFDTLYRAAMRLLARGAAPQPQTAPARQRRRA